MCNDILWKKVFANRCMYITEYDMDTSDLRYVSLQSNVYVVEHYRNESTINNSVFG